MDIDVKCAYNLKLVSNGEIVKYKARLVANEFLQMLEIDFNEVRALVARLETMKHTNGKRCINWM